MMITYIRHWKENPRCKHCKKEMDYWVPGLSAEKHAHVDCAAIAAAKRVLRKFKRREKT